MKKSLVALAALSAMSAFADVDVSGGIKMYGVLDQAYLWQTWKNSGSTTVTSNTGLYAAGATSRLGVRGARDLGDDIKGLFQIEIELQPQNNSDQAGGGKSNGLLNPKNRGTFVGLEKKDAGSIRLGTQETTAYELFAMDVNGRVEYKPQVWRYVASNSTQDRAGQSIKFTTAEFAGFSASYMTARPVTAFGTNAKVTPEFDSFGLKYNGGALQVALVNDSISGSNADSASGNYRMPGNQYEGVVTADGSKVTYAYTTLLKIQRNIVGVTYDFGPAKVSFIHADSGNSIGRLNTDTIGVRVPYEKFAFAMSYGQGSYSGEQTPGTASKGTVSDTTIGAYYNFDKSTSVYLLASDARHTKSGYTAGYTSSMATGVQYRF
jgi:predicted porin